MYRRHPRPPRLDPLLFTALRLADEGLSQRQIAAELGVSPMTVNRALAVPNDTDEGASPARQPANPVPNDTAEPPLPHVAQASGENECTGQPTIAKRPDVVAHVADFPAAPAASRRARAPHAARQPSGPSL